MPGVIGGPMNPGSLDPRWTRVHRTLDEPGFIEPSYNLSLWSLYRQKRHRRPTLPVRRFLHIEFFLSLIYIYICVYKYIYVYNACIYVLCTMYHVHVYVHVYIYIYTYIYIYICILYIYIYICAYTHRNIALQSWEFEAASAPSKKRAASAPSKKRAASAATTAAVFVFFQDRVSRSDPPQIPGRFQGEQQRN